MIYTYKMPRLDPIFAESAMIKAGFQPLEPYINALTKWKCICLSCHTIVYPKYNTIQQKRGGCRNCANKKMSITLRLEQSEAVRRMIEAKLQPLTEFKNTASKWKSECMICHKIVYPTLSDVTGGHQGCKHCARKKVVDLLRLKEQDAIDLMLQNNLKPLEKYQDSKYPWKCRCLKCGKIVKPTYSSIQQKKGGCTYCAGNKVDPKQAERYMKKAGLQPLEPYLNNKAKWKCKCLKCGRIVSPTYGGVRSGQGGCVTCGKKLGGEKNRIPETEAIRLMLEANLKPLVPYRSRQTPWKCKCLNCGSIVKPQLATVLDGGKCIVCRPFGLNMKQPAYLYLISHDEFNAYKVGLGTKKKNDDRLQKFIKRGWKTYRVWHFKSGKEALKIEKAFFKYVRKELKIPEYLSKTLMKETTGHTETMDADQISLPEIEKIINRMIGD